MDRKQILEKRQEERQRQLENRKKKMKLERAM